MKHITGIGGIFFKANDPEKLGEWYRKHLGLDVEEYGGVTFREGEAPAEGPQATGLHRLVAFPGRYRLFRSKRKAIHDQFPSGRP